MGFIADEPIEGFAAGGRVLSSSPALIGAGGSFCFYGASEAIPLSKGQTVGIFAPSALSRDASASFGQTNYFTFLPSAVGEAVAQHVRAAGKSATRAVIERSRRPSLPITQIDGDGHTVEDCRNRFLSYPFGPAPFFVPPQQK
jgi:hypothetical protein